MSLSFLGLAARIRCGQRDLFDIPVRVSAFHVWQNTAEIDTPVGGRWPWTISSEAAIPWIAGKVRANFLHGGGS